MRWLPLEEGKVMGWQGGFGLGGGGGGGCVRLMGSGCCFHCRLCDSVWFFFFLSQRATSGPIDAAAKPEKGRACAQRM